MNDRRSQTRRRTSVEETGVAGPAIPRDGTEREALEAAERREHRLYLATVRSLAATVDARDVYTHSHSQQVAFYCRLIVGELGLPAPEAETIELAGLLHDIGKIAIPDTILQKPSRLTPAEWAIMRTHAARGADILNAGDSPALAAIVPMVRHHHERWQGGGYPDDLVGAAIPLGALVIAVADAFDTITTARPYKPAQGLDAACAEIARAAGSQFEPEVVAAFLRAVARDRATGAAYLEAITQGAEPGASVLPRFAAVLDPGGIAGPQSLSYQEQQRLAAHRQALYQIARGFHGVADEEGIAVAIAQLGREHFGAENVYLLEWQDTTGAAIAPGMPGPPARIVARWGWQTTAPFTPFTLVVDTQVPIARALLGATGPVAVPDLGSVSGPQLRTLMAQHSWRSGVFVPLRAAGNTIGALALSYESSYHHFTPDDLELADALGAETARALAGLHLQRAAAQLRAQIAALEASNAALERRNHDLAVLNVTTQQQATELALINRVAHSITALVADDLDLLLTNAAALLQRELRHINVAIMLVDAPTGELVCRASAGEYARFVPVGYRQATSVGLAGWVATHGTTFVANDVAAEPCFYQVAPEETPGAEVVVPLIHHGRVIGVLDAENAAPHSFSPSAVQTLETLADQLAVAIAQGHLFHELRLQVIQARHPTEAA